MATPRAELGEEQVGRKQNFLFPDLSLDLTSGDMIIENHRSPEHHDSLTHTPLNVALIRQVTDLVSLGQLKIEKYHWQDFRKQNRQYVDERPLPTWVISI